MRGSATSTSITRINGYTRDGALEVPSRLCPASRQPSLSRFKQVCAQTANPHTYIKAFSITSNIPEYFSPHELQLKDPEFIDRWQDELHHILVSGPGVFVIRQFCTDKALLKDVNTVFSAIIDSEASESRGDHFAVSGKNARIWNSFQKHAERDPTSFVKYYSNPLLAIVAEAWLGPAYQVTAQVNIVKPGGQPQVSHRDYHLGFQSSESCSQFPKATQVASQFLTLQGAIAHSNMPLESGPTRFLPFSQQFQEGYMAYRHKEFQDYFNDNWVSVDLKMGDAVFFNPALFHAAGENKTTNLDRSANLLQISSAFGRTMETIDTVKIISKCWEDVRRLYSEAGMTDQVRAILAALGEGYPFPTNLDRRPPAPGGMAPESEIDVLRRGLEQDWDTTKVITEIMILRQNSMA
ncbi:hypothetical protein EDD37DRAFT_567418 [Exophiala viscosa]|uniref:uncharacterized protein n=1 Tax=Exophiala viscosa TaxID=2486360 RepID=UPI00218E089A|nr:hypothetical protein EDD37DRAFT_567418 [Exophiala viscosa]